MARFIGEVGKRLILEVKYIEAPEFPRLCYRITGSGPVIVLIHGFPQTSELWSEVWDELARSFTLIMPDLPGIGGSKPIGRDVTIEQLAESVKYILDAEHVDHAVIAGHSMGGYTALAFASLYPGFLKGICMIHSVKDADTEEKKETRRKAIALIEKGGKEVFIRQMIPNLFSASFKERHPETVAKQINDALTTTEEGLTAFYNAMINRPERGKTLTGADFPVQWIIGRDDSIAPAGKVLQQSMLASVNFVSLYNDCAHMAMLEQPVELTKDLTYFGKYCYKK